MDDQCGQVRRAGLLFIPVVEEKVGGAQLHSNYLVTSAMGCG